MVTHRSQDLQEGAPYPVHPGSDIVIRVPSTFCGIHRSTIIDTEVDSVKEAMNWNDRRNSTSNRLLVGETLHPTLHKQEDEVAEDMFLA